MVRETEELLKTIVCAMEDKKAEDIAVLDLRELSPLVDYFVICSGVSKVHLDTVAENILKKLKEEHNFYPSHVEGTSGSGWILIDAQDIMVHIFSPKKREFYDLEGLWWEAKRVEISQKPKEEVLEPV